MSKDQKQEQQALTPQAIAEALSGKGFRCYAEEDKTYTVVGPDKARFVVDPQEAKVGRGRHFRQGQLEGETLDVFTAMRSDATAAVEIAKAMHSGAQTPSKSWGDLLG